MIRHPITGLLAALMLFLAAACSSTPEATHSESEAPYPEKRYLKAVGYGQTRAEAEREARAALAGIFQSRVQAETMARARSVMADGAEAHFEKQVESTVRVVSEVALVGVQVVDTVTDESTGAFTATAVLDRQQAGRRWREALMRTDTLLVAELEALPATRGKLLRLASLNRAMGLMLRQEALRSRLRVVGQPIGVAEPDMASVASELAALRREALLFVNLSGEEAMAAERVIRDRLSDGGFLMAGSEAAAIGVVTGSVQLQPLDLNNPKINFVRAIVSVQVVDTETDTRLLSVTEKVRKGHVDANEAVRKAIDAAAQRAADRVARELGFLGVADTASP